MLFFVQPRGGITGRLAAAAQKQPDRSVTVLLEGPYGGMSARWDKGFDRTLLVAGGSGCGLTLGLIEAWLRAGEGLQGHERHLEVVLATRDPEMRIWYMEELQRIAERQPTQGKTELPGVTVSFSETYDESAVAGGSGSSSGDEEKKTAVSSAKKTGGSSTTETLFGVRFSHGRPDTKAAVKRHAEHAGATVGVAVCGPASMAHDVSTAAAEAQLRIVRGQPGAAELYLHKEAFS